ncbi:hypothetical protein CBF_2602 [Clostridium botulinum F str. 230613]|uniref:Uncharacterized protein n=1 Tax=Clostridium botulinum (strain Langeland / NCTC 10281 / Type F) TaxID=441772 RepID=A7GGD5_CLOBL|nr:hypothetical protein CLI_2611 [Clostridium botulinum F str. Langeland]ADG00249.1 hypothetical protein CBF_2602 [Clostridium botulinum F str. 230613]
MFLATIFIAYTTNSLPKLLLQLFIPYISITPGIEYILF